MFVAAAGLTLGCGCNGIAKNSPASHTAAVRVERETPGMPDPGASPSQRSQAYRSAYQEGLDLVKQGQYGLALGAFEKALELRPNSPTALFNIGACHESIGDPLRAINYYRRVLALNPDDADCYRNLGTSFIKLYYREKSPAWRQMAQDAWKRSLSIRPDQPDIRAYLAHEPSLAHLAKD
jgi:tetratricopeptide (TPR) repeat protein